MVENDEGPIDFYRNLHVSVKAAVVLGWSKRDGFGHS